MPRDNSWMELDPYGADLCPPTSGQDCIYKLERDPEGFVTAVLGLSPEETEAIRKEGRKGAASPTRGRTRHGARRSAKNLSAASNTRVDVGQPSGQHPTRTRRAKRG